MDALPSQFYEKVITSIHSTRFLIECGTLSGEIGVVANGHLDNDASYVKEFNNGKMKEERLLILHRRREDGSRIKIEETTNKYLALFQVTIVDTPREGPEEDTAGDYKIPEITKNTNVTVMLESSQIGEGSERLPQSIKSINFLFIEVPITERMQKTIEIVVEKKTLNNISFNSDHEFTELSTKALTGLLKQDQFNTAFLSENCRLSLDDVIAEWKQNSHLMIGKKLVFESKWEDQCKESGFEECSEDEYQVVCYNYKPSSTVYRLFILRGQNESAAYAFIRDDGSYSKIMFR